MESAWIPYDFQFSRPFKEITEDFQKGIQPIHAPYLYHIKYFSVKDLSVSSRTINHWDKLGLLTEQERTAEAWRKFSISERAWIEVIHKLRSFGLPLEKLTTTRESLFFYDNLPSPYFDIAIFGVINDKPMVLIVNTDGQARILEEKFVWIAKEDYRLSNFISIDFNQITELAMGYGETRQRNYSGYAWVKQEEGELLSFLRGGKFKQVVVHYANGRMDRFDGDQIREVGSNIMNVLNEQPFQEVRAIKENGKIVGIIQRMKKKIPT